MQSIYKKLSLAVSLAFISFGSFAADTANAAVPAASTNANFNPVLCALGSVIIVLFFVIAVLGMVMRNLAFLYRDKMRSDRMGNITKSVLLLLTLGFASLQAFGQDATPAPATVGGMLASEFYTMMSVIGLELVIVFTMILYMRTLINSIKKSPEFESITAPKESRLSFWDKFHDLKPIEREADLLLDHDYDGIKELDNSLPPWWKYGFYFTIFTGIIYLYYYHGGGNGPSSAEEYNIEVQKGEADKAAYLAKTAGNIDETNVKMEDAVGIAAGKELFVKNCAPCHQPDGGGLVGPNLTDDYWLHGGALKDVFKTITYGYIDKGMKSWKGDFSPKQIQCLASFVKSLHGTKPAKPKDKQGELYVEASAAATPVDSTKKAPANDSTEKK
jgi:cytochrome c oxidase cbb3-type subunit 3